MPGTSIVTAFNFTVHGNVSSLVGMHYSNGQLIATDGGNTLYHRDGSIMRSGSTWTYDAGATLKSGASYWWSNGTTLKSSLNFFHPTGGPARNSLYYGDGSIYEVGDDLYYPNGFPLRLEPNTYFYETGNILRFPTNFIDQTTVIYYPWGGNPLGSVMVDANGTPYDEFGNAAAVPFSHNETFTDSEVTVNVSAGFSETTTAISNVFSGSIAAYVNYSMLEYAVGKPTGLHVISRGPDFITFAFTEAAATSHEYEASWNSNAVGGSVSFTGNQFMISGLDANRSVTVQLKTKREIPFHVLSNHDFAYTPGPTILARTTRRGDYNQNGAVDAGDFVLWRKTLGSTVFNSSGADGSGNGQVGPEDYDVWREIFGSVAGGAAHATLVSVPSTTPGVIDRPEDEDWYAFNAAAGVSYLLDATLGTLSSARLTLYNTDGTSPIAISLAGSSPIAWTAPVSGTYYLALLPLTGTGSYEISTAITAGSGSSSALDVQEPLSFSLNSDEEPTTNTRVADSKAELAETFTQVESMTFDSFTRAHLSFVRTARPFFAARLSLIPRAYIDQLSTTWTNSKVDRDWPSAPLIAPAPPPDELPLVVDAAFEALNTCVLERVIRV